MDVTALPASRVEEFLDRIADLNRRYRAGDVHVNVPGGLGDGDRTIDELAAQLFPASHAAFDAASRGLFFSLPVAFDPSESVGPYLAVIDRDPSGRPYRFLDMGALIATHAFGENDPAVTQAIVDSLPFVVSRYAHSEYQTVLSLKLKAALSRIAPTGTPRYFVCNTGAESVENAIKSVLMNRVMTTDNADGGFVVSFEGAFHGRTLGSLAVTHRKKARLGFPTFDWPHILFPVDDPGAPKATLQREDRCLKQLWDLLVSGRMPGADKSKDAYRREIDAIDEFLSQAATASTSSGPSTSVGPMQAIDFVHAQRANLSPDVLKRAKRVAAVLIEPIQGEGGIRPVSPRFMRKLRLLTRIYDVPLVCDEVQTGFGATGRLWAHELFDMPFPPDVVTWAKKAQNGILFVSEELATFFQEEKKFNTTWEGDSVGMVRLLALIDKLDLTQVSRAGEAARKGLDTLARDFKQFVKHVRGCGVMLGFDVIRADWRDALLDRAFRRGLVLLPAGERCIRFYPRYDMTDAALEEALSILRAAVTDLAGGAAATDAPTPRIRVGTLAIPLETVEAIDLSPQTFEPVKPQIAGVEQERYGSGQHPTLKLPIETLETTIANPKAIGVALRDKVSGRVVAYALGSALENHDEEGCASDPHYGENDTFYLQASAVLPSVQNEIEIENHLLELLRTRAVAAGFGFLSTLIEESVRETGPQWIRDAPVVERMENYLGSGITFAYLNAQLTTNADPATRG